MCELKSFFLGFVTNLITALLVFYWQFHSSTAYDCLEKTVEATKRIVGSPINRGSLRNNYRDYLGVIIDTLDKIWDKDGFEEDKWPCLVNFADAEDGRIVIANRDGRPDCKADRWDLFNLRVRPVAQDISSYAFLGWFRWCPLYPIFRQLDALTKLCSQIKVVVGRFDAAYGKDLVELCRVSSEVVVQPTVGSTDSGEIKPLRCDYRKLYHAWGKWLDAANVSRN